MQIKNQWVHTHRLYCCPNIQEQENSFVNGSMSDSGKVGSCSKTFFWLTFCFQIPNKLAMASSVLEKQRCLAIVRHSVIFILPCHLGYPTVKAHTAYTVTGSFLLVCPKSQNWTGKKRHLNLLLPLLGTSYKKSWNLMSWFRWTPVRGCWMTWRKKHLAENVLPDLSFYDGGQCWQIFAAFACCFMSFNVLMYLVFVCIYGCSLSVGNLLIVLLPMLARTLLKKKCLISMRFFPS